ncbi:iron chelate uptake ABC transporter family permease subunit [Paracoccus sp. TK19116]|uniref:Iron chelate uptake ABC transporter family permease subunit n=1 Tax=Paracoccus albicereus TaxID=2922394 RepID=A0ABT1MMP2_9RHOB|nr:iron chelate uptake ABC transporter family permease subunit [Paracoccus albicereus]MCQ0969555.1 iron chelate uptake ABC transporter family permease subunit [Paracoccus albicereus]
MSRRLIAPLALVTLSILSLFVGVTEIGTGDVLRDPEARALMLTSRLPRLFAVLITGASLAIAGAIMQMLVRNRFVEPMTVGTGQGAALGVLIVTIAAPGAPLLVQMTLAAATAFGTSLGFLAIAHRMPPSQPFLVALVGLIYGGIIGAGVTFVAYQADLLQYIDIWTNGEFSGILQGRYETLWLAAAVAGLAYLAADQFSILGMGRTVSIGLGLNYGQVMLFGLAAVSLVSAMTVTIVGMIPFVGLVVPNIVSRIMGDDLRRTLPQIALSGAVLVLGADILARVLRAPYEMPVGTVLGIMGAALFLWLLYRPAPRVR